MSKTNHGGSAPRRGVGLSAPVLALLAATASSAYAQNAPGEVQMAQATPAPAASKAAAKAKPAEVAPEEIVVTGSRIRQPNLTSASPVTAVSNQEFKLQGTTNVEDLLNNMPQVFAGYGAAVSNGSTGTATVDLRSLGSKRTLVLVDGKRMMPGDPALPVADLNAISSQMVDRVEILTGGASAVYGSDAIAGVVNFITKKNFEGVQVDAQYSFAQHDNQDKRVQALVTARGFQQAPSSVTDGQVYDVNVKVGANSDNGKGNVTLYAGYRNTQPVLQSQRDWSSCALGTTGAKLDVQACGGSSTSFPGRFVSLDNGGGNKTVDANGNLVAWTSAANAFNYGPINYIQRGDDKYNFGASGHYEVSKYADIYSDFMFTDDHTVAQIAPSGLFFGTTWTVNCDNPLLSTSQKALWCKGLGPTDNASLFIGRRFVESGGRQDDLRHTSYRIDVGSRGELGHGWSYDAYVQYGAMIYSEIYRNDMSITRLNRALQVVNVNGVPTCKSVVDGSDPACVPLTIFNSQGISAKSLGYVSVPLFKEGSTTEQIASGSLSGDLGTYGLKSPAASEGVKVALGGEYRRETLKLEPDLEFTSGDGAGQGGPTKSSKGAYSVRELFGEMRVPLVQDKMFFKSLAVEGGYRSSQYTSAGSTDAYMAKVEWGPVADGHFRASFQHAVRAPNASELYVESGLSLYGGSDPCATADGTGKPTASLAQCLLTGMTAAQYGKTIDCPAAQCNNLTGGNPLLKPEDSDTKSFGAVFTPTFIEGFNLSVDYFDIKVNNFISTAGIPATVSVSQCIATGAPIFCSLIHRAPGTGVLFGTGANAGYVQATTVNTGSLATKGIDVEFNYRRELPNWRAGGLGDVAFNLIGTYTDSLVNEPVLGFGKYDCAGLFGATCGTPTPKWRHKLRVTWETPWDLNLSLNWRYIAQTKLDLNDPNSFLNGGQYDNFDAKIPAYHYIDISGSWRYKDRYTFRAGINNLFDKDPPIVDNANFGISSAPFGNGNTYPQVYDSLGRKIFVGVTVDF